MFSIPKRLRRHALLALVALGTVGGSVSAASAQPNWTGDGRDCGNWQHAPRYQERHSNYQRHYGYPYDRTGYGGVDTAPVYYGGDQTGYNSDPSYGDEDQVSDYPVGGYDGQGYDQRDDEGRALSEWQYQDSGYDDDDD